MKKILLGFATVATLALGFTACDKNDGPESGQGSGEIGGEIGGGTGSMETLSPEQSKQFLSDAANEAISLFNPADQQALIDLCGYFVQNYGDLELPLNFFLEEDDYNYVNDYFDAMARSLSGGDLVGFSRATPDYVYDINFNLFKGIYEPGKYEWQKVDDSNDVIFRFPYKGQTVELRTSGSSNSYNTSLEWTEEGYYYKDTTILNFTVPNQVNVTLKAGDTTHLSAVVNSNVSFENHNYTIQCDVQLANISLSVVSNGNDSQVSESCEIKVGGAPFLSTEAVVNGSNLCNPDFYERNQDNEDVILSTVLKKGTAKVNIVNKVQVYANYNYFPGIMEGYDDENELLTQAYVALLNQNTSASVKYNNTTTEQARINWTYTVDSYSSPYYSYKYYELEPQLVFSDGSSYYFESYFNKGFAGVQTAFENLINRYQSVIDRAF